LGLALTPFVAGAGLLLLVVFVRWTERRVRYDQDPLFRLGLFDIRPVKGGLQMFLAQNLILMGVFFSIPLYLQVVQGLDALDTGIRMLPVSVTMFIMSFVGARMSSSRTPQWIVKLGLWVLLGSIVILSGTIEADLRGIAFGVSMALLGVGMGLLASQLGNVIQSAVAQEDRSEAGGLQYTAQQLGSSIGTALIGAIVISSLSAAFIMNVSNDPRIPDELKAEVSVALSSGIEFVNSQVLEDGLAESDLPEEEQDAILAAYESGQLQALRTGLFVAAVVVVIALLLSRRIPAVSFAEMAAAQTDAQEIASG
jgi:hypothetical protein